jgi:MSHA biogenesis protein MshP
MSLLIAIFMLVVFSFIGITLVAILTNQNISSSEELLSTKALFLAESGVEIAITDNKSPGNYGPYTIGNGNINFIVTDIGDILNDPEYKDIYKVESTGYIGDVKRKVVVKYKR